MLLFDKFINKISKHIAIDLGTANIRVFVEGKKEILKEPSVVALNKSNDKILAVGFEARKMIGRTPANIVAVQPLKNGVISDFKATEAIIYYFLERVKKDLPLISRIIKPCVLVGVPSLITEVEMKAVIDSATSAGAMKVYIIEEPMAASIGANLKIEEASGKMIVDIGGGTTDIAVISMGGVVVDNTIRVAGDKMDQAISDYIREKYNLLISAKMSEDIKIAHLKFTNNENAQFEVKGQDLHSGLPKVLTMYQSELTDALVPLVNQIAKAISNAIENTPPEIVSDLLMNGICLTGGGALIQGLDKYLSSKLKTPVYVAENPGYSVVEGLSKLTNDIDLLDKVQVKDFILR
jgi:rod shape-determining protein MreB